jgi:hypothetical protein
VATNFGHGQQQIEQAMNLNLVPKNMSRIRVLRILVEAREFRALIGGLIILAMIAWVSVKDRHELMAGQASARHPEQAHHAHKHG